MKIVNLVSPYISPTCTWLQNTMVLNSKFENIVFTQKKITIQKNILVIGPDEFNIINFLTNRILRKVFLISGFGFEKYYLQHKPKIFHSHFLYECYYWHYFTTKFKIPHVVSVYGHDISEYGKLVKWKKRYSKIFNLIDKVIVEGPNMANNLEKMGCPSTKVEIIPIGIDSSDITIKKDYRIENRIKILQVASFKEKKGIEYTLLAVSEAKKNNLEIDLYLIGDGELKNKYIEIINREGIVENVHFLGFVIPEIVRRTLYMYDIFIHPSVLAENGDTEGGFPVILTEACAAGLPIISTYHADIPFIIHNEINGILVPERDYVSLYESIYKLFINQDLREKYGTNSIEVVRNKFTIEKQIETLNALYNSLIK
ncbi:MAG: glycosyltransferase family 4 protein [Bacteroidetes bacterium]|nr:glycosyltransferase family 4 protein [Bacteroidota bacterium]